MMSTMNVTAKLQGSVRLSARKSAAQQPLATRVQGKSARKAVVVKAGEWVEAFDEGLQKTYYYHSVSKEFSWTLPAGASASMESAAPATTSSYESYSAPAASAPVSEPASGEWIKAFDSGLNKEYYYHSKSKEISWTLPAGATAGVEAPAPVTSSYESYSAPAAAAPAAASSTGEWVKAFDSGLNKEYYYHSKSKEISWTLPAGATATTETAAPATTSYESSYSAPAAAAPATTSSTGEWVKAFDAGLNKEYYYHSKSKEISWTLPVGATASAESSMASEVQSLERSLTMEQTDSAPAAGSSGAEWVKAFDEGLQREYYYHAVSKEVSWTLPAGASATSEAPKASVESSYSW